MPMNSKLQPSPLSFKTLLGIALFATAVLIFNFLQPARSHKNPGQDASNSIPEIHLKLSPKNLNRLKDMKTQATIHGRKTEQKGEWIKSELIEGQERYKVRLRIRGLAPNHWSGQKISLYVKLRKIKETGKLWRGMRAADLIIPGDKQWFQEAITSFMSERMGLIAARVDFVKLYINGTYQGPYILSDRMTQELLERNNSPAAPIYRPVHMTLPGWGDVGYVSDPRIIYNLPMWENKLDEAEQLDGVNSLLQKVFELLSEEPFTEATYQKLRYFLDMPKIATFHALAKLLGGHAEQLHNVILYFDSSTSQFQMILRDTAFESREADRFEWGPVESTWPIVTKQLIENDQFRMLRDQELKRLTGFEEDFFSFYDNWWKRNFEIIDRDPLDRDLFALDAGKRGTPDYVRARARTVYQENFDLIRSILKIYPKQQTYKIPTENPKFISVQFLIKTEGPVGESSSGPPRRAGKLIIRHDSPRPLFLETLSVIPALLRRSEKFASQRRGLTLNSSDQSEIASVTVFPRNDVIASPPKSLAGKEADLSAVVDEAISNPMEKIELPVGKDAEIPILTPDSREIQWTAQFSRDGLPLPDSQVLLTSSWVSDHGIDFSFLEASAESILQERSKIQFQRSGHEIVIKPGHYRVSQTLTLSKGRRLIFSSGTILEFDPNISFITYSPVSIRGTQNAPVVFRSADPEKGWGVFAVLQTNDDGETNEISGLSMSDSRGAVHNAIQYTAGLAFFKSNVTIRNSFFHHNGLDDALNIKRSQVQIEGNFFIDNPSDAFDGDWVSGKISGNFFYHNGGDSIDLSGSHDILLANNIILASGDKAFSIGENTQAQVRQNFLGLCHFGLVAKDLSQVESADNLYYKNEIALSAYEKKPIFGGGRIVSKTEIFMENLEQTKSDPKSSITLEDERTISKLELSLGEPSSALEAADFALRVLKDAKLSWEGVETWPTKLREWDLEATS